MSSQRRYGAPVALNVLWDDLPDDMNDTLVRQALQTIHERITQAKAIALRTQGLAVIRPVPSARPRRRSPSRSPQQCAPSPNTACSPDRTTQTTATPNEHPQTSKSQSLLRVHDHIAVIRRGHQRVDPIRRESTGTLTGRCGPGHSLPTGRPLDADRARTAGAPGGQGPARRPRPGHR